MKNFLESLPYILPCKFCRSSLITYYQDLPIQDALESKNTLSKWFYKIHGKVNQKLRKQGQTIPRDPPFSTVRKIYTERLSYGCSKTEFPGWEFLFSLVENHPLADSTTSPMPGAPNPNTLHTEEDLVKWNYISPQRRYEELCRFWASLPYVLPFQEWRSAWKRHGGDFCAQKWVSKQDSLRSLYQIRCSIEKELELLNKTSFRSLCNDLRLHRSGCASSRRARTCRAQKTRKQRH